ncbi:hypothetical protein [Streptomyces sp. NPDC046371]|uniref:hypothetical protein n=1 Tax=Streptomyces sp. NPDC046371 TaxID=3154916 RepID=UPI0033D3A374
MTWLTVFLFSHGHETFESKTRGRCGIFDSMAGGAGLWVLMVLDRRQLVSVAPIERVGLGSDRPSATVSVRGSSPVWVTLL